MTLTTEPVMKKKQQAKKKATPKQEPKKRQRHVLGRQRYVDESGNRVVMEFTPAGLCVRRVGQRRTKATVIPHEQLCREGCHRYEVYTLNGEDYHVRAEPKGVTVRRKPDGPVVRTLAPEAIVDGQVLVQASLFQTPHPQ